MLGFHGVGEHADSDEEVHSEEETRTIALLDGGSAHFVRQGFCRRHLLYASALALAACCLTAGIRFAARWRAGVPAVTATADIAEEWVLHTCAKVKQRKFCGDSGEQACKQIGCCWDGAQAPHCFSKYDAAPAPECAVPDAEKVDCGHHGITKEKCMNKGACYVPSQVPKVPYCYCKKTKEPEFAKKSVEKWNPNRTLKVACVGASITEGMPAYGNPDYETTLQGLLRNGGFKGAVVKNFGRCGTTVLKKGHFLNKPGSAFWGNSNADEQAIEFMPDVVVTQFADDDSRKVNWKGPQTRPVYVRDYIDLVASFQKLPSQPTVILMRPPPLYVEGRYAMRKFVTNVVIDGLLEKVRQDRGLPPIADVFSEFDRHCPIKDNTRTHHDCDLIATDMGLAKRPGFEGVHPTSAGNALMASVVYRSIKDTLMPAPPQQCLFVIPIVNFCFPKLR